MNIASAEYIEIRKHNLLGIYSKARSSAFQPATIHSAFRTCGIWSFDPSVIEENAYAPALNSTTKAAQLVPAALPILLVPATSEAVESVLVHSSVTELSERLDNLQVSNYSEVSQSTHSSNVSPSADSMTDHARISTAPPAIRGHQFVLARLPKELPPLSSVAAFKAENAELRCLLEQARYQMEMDFAFKKLMDNENGRLRARLFDKSHKHQKKQTTGFARHMTNDDNLDALAKEDWRLKMKDVWCDKGFRARRDAYEAYEKSIVAAEKAAEREAERSRKEAEKLQKEADKEEECSRKAEERETHKRAKDAERARLQVEKEHERSEKAAEKRCAMQEKARVKGLKDAQRARTAAAKAAKTLKVPSAVTRTARGCKANEAEVIAVTVVQGADGGLDGTAVIEAAVEKRPRPRPTRVTRAQAAQGNK